MEPLTRQVRRAQRRLAWHQFARVLVWCWFAGLLVATVLVAVDKHWPQGPIAAASQKTLTMAGLAVQPELRAGMWSAAGLLAGLVAALAWTWFTRRGALDAAIELDKRFGLKERVSSTLALSPHELESAAGQALVADAVRRVEQIEVSERFGLTFSRWTWLPLVPAVAAFLLAIFLPEVTRTDPATTQAATTTQHAQVKKQTKALQRSLEQRRREAREKGLLEAEDMFQRLERETGDMSRTPQQDRKQALVRLNDLADELEKRRQDLAASDKIRQQLNQLRPSQSGPADKLSQALQEGDLKQAMRQIEDLKQQLADGKLDKDGREKLGQQLAEMEQKLRQAAEGHKQAKQELQDQIDQKQKSGDKEGAKKLQQQLARLEQQDQQMRQLEDMAQKLGQCSKCLKEGKSEEAMASLEDMEAELKGLQQQLEEMEMLDEALDEIAECKDGMCQGGKKSGQPGDGLGEGEGRGDRPIEKSDGRFYDSKVRQKPNGGTGVVTGLADGPNVRGDVDQQIQTEIEAATTADSDPLTGQRLPREYREHARGYFDMLREGEPEPEAE
jgi:hypothetical protein